jgi:hypothetical protein
MAKHARTEPTAPYTPNDWTEGQAAMHQPKTLDEAFHSASCLAGGWYRRHVTIDFRTVPLPEPVMVSGHRCTHGEEYMFRPADVAPLDGWTPCYTVTAHA